MGGILDAFIFMRVFPCLSFLIFVFTPKPLEFSAFKIILIISVVDLTFTFDLVELWTHYFSCKFCPLFVLFNVFFTPKPPAFSTYNLIFIIFVGDLSFSIDLVEFWTHYFSCKFCPLLVLFHCCFHPQTTSFFNIQDNFDNLCWQLNIFHWLGGILVAFIFMKILTTFCPLFSCFWLRNHQHFQQSSWFSKSLLLTWSFLLIWWSSGHINFHVNFALCLSFFIVVFNPKPPAFSTSKLILIIFVCNLTVSIVWVEFWTLLSSWEFSPVCPFSFLFSLPNH